MDGFDPNGSVLLDDAVLEALKRMGFSEYGALEWVDDRQMRAIRFQLLRKRTEELPFEMSIEKPERLIGKGRVRTQDSPETRALRSRLSVVEPLMSVLASIGDRDFEHVCAAIVSRAGAVEAGVTAPGNEGGIDFYGRIAVLVGDPTVPRGLVRTTLDIQPVLFLGQAKRYSLDTAISRPELQKFAGQVRDCIAKYPNMDNPPAHRVPDGYYEPNEICLSFFFTTAQFSSGARDYARAVNMILADGRLLAELLVFWGFGPMEASRVDAGAVRSWIEGLKAPQLFRAEEHLGDTGTPGQS